MSSCMSGEGGRETASVVLCTYNGERYLPAQLQSLLEQTRLPDEIVIVDDGSVDSTWEIIEEFSCKARAVGANMVINRNDENLGYVKNFERAIGRSSADIVFLCDQDDIWHPDKVERMAREFAGRPQLLLLHTDARLIGADGEDMECGLFGALEMTARELSQLHSGNGFEVLLRRSVVTGATAAFRKSIVSSIFPFPAEWVHDEWLAISCASKGLVDCLEDKLIDYRQHSGNQIGVRKRTWVEKLSHSGLSRREHFRKVEKRLKVLVKRLPTLEDDISRKCQDALLHAAARAWLPTGWMSRFLWVVKEVRTGRYGSYSFGMRSVIADLLGLE